MEGGAPRAGYSLAEAAIWYGYCSYNPLRYVDPDGREGIPHLTPESFWQFLGLGDKMIGLFYAAFRGDAEAQESVGMIFHEAGKEVLEGMSAQSDTATLVFLAVGCPKGACVASGVGLVSEGILLVDDMLSGDKETARSRIVNFVAGIFVKETVKGAIKETINAGIKIRMGKNGVFYSLSRRGAMKTKEAFRRLLMKDIAESRLGDLAPEVAGQLVKKALEAYDAIQKAIE